MKRSVMQQLYEWKQNANRKPLILQGARQVGKTWLMKTFAEQAFDKYVYVNFENNQSLVDLFKKDFDMNRILLELQIATRERITQDTLLLFDEIQEVERGVTSLKYFQELLPHQPIIAAGSLLGIAMHRNNSFPVGKVDFVTIYPMSFSEFVEANGEGMLLEQLQSGNWDILATFGSRLENLLRMYYFVGGMPEAVADFIKNKDLRSVRTIQNAILDSYDRDFSKHAPQTEVPRLRMIWRSIVGQLSKENKKFIYGFIKEGARAKDFELAIEWLKDAGLIYRVNRTKKAQMPLSAYEDFSAFKLFLLDVGLLCAMANLPEQTLLQKNNFIVEFKGALTEQYVMQQLATLKRKDIYYWSQDNSQGEIDFLVQYSNKILPIEVKAENNLQAKSMRMFIQRNPELHGLRFSMSNLQEQEWLTNYPLYAVESAIKNIF